MPSLVCEDLDFERTQRGMDVSEVVPDQLVRVVSATTGIPETTLLGEADQPDFEAALAGDIFGQPDAVAQVASELRLIRAGLVDPDKPASVLLFAGMTGVGKTELAKRLAELYSTSHRLQTYPMGNFTEPHSVSGIIGVPPGYVGHEQGGRLVNDLNSDPYSVFLLDDAGADAISQMTASGHSTDEIETRVRQILSKVRHERSSQPVFTPQFLARVKKVIVFRPLGADAMLNICRKLAGQIQSAWQRRRDKSLEIADDVLASIAERGHDLNLKSGGREGGRIIRKLLSELESRIQTVAAKDAVHFKECHTVRVSRRNSKPHDSAMRDPEYEFVFERGDR